RRAGIVSASLEQLLQAFFQFLVHFFFRFLLGGVLDHFLGGVAFALDAEFLGDAILGSTGGHVLADGLEAVLVVTAPIGSITGQVATATHRPGLVLEILVVGQFR